MLYIHTKHTEQHTVRETKNSDLKHNFKKTLTKQKSRESTAVYTINTYIIDGIVWV